MEKKEFEKLFEDYIQNTLSDEQLEDFMQVVNTNQYDNFINDKIYTSLKEDEPSAFIDQQRGEIILKEILSQKANTSKVIALAPRSSRKIRLLFAAASIAGLVLLGNTLFFKSNLPIHSDKVEQTKNLENPLIAFSGRQLVHLPDGSTVVLNDQSSLKYNQNSFNGKTREVTLTGEAFFDIKRNEKKAFIVHTGKVQTKVLGTAFNINARNSSDDIEVTVSRGKVQVGDTQKIYGVITPNQQIKVNKHTLNYQQNNNISVAIVTEWKSNYLILDDINMEEAVKLISQKYKVQISLSNEKIKKCRIMASFLNKEDLDHVLRVVCSVIETEYHYTKPGYIMIDGKGCE